MGSRPLSPSKKGGNRGRQKILWKKCTFCVDLYLIVSSFCCYAESSSFFGTFLFLRFDVNMWCFVCVCVCVSVCVFVFVCVCVFRWYLGMHLILSLYVDSDLFAKSVLYTNIRVLVQISNILSST